VRGRAREGGRKELERESKEARVEEQRESQRERVQVRQRMFGLARVCAKERQRGGHVLAPTHTHP